MIKKRLAAVAVALTLPLSAGAMVACDREDVRDVEEAGQDVEENVRKAGKNIERQVDKNIDTDGRDN